MEKSAVPSSAECLDFCPVYLRVDEKDLSDHTSNVRYLSMDTLTTDVIMPRS